jgi:hypothetical protein
MAVLDETPGLVVGILADHVPLSEYEDGSPRLSLILLNLFLYTKVS